MLLRACNTELHALQPVTEDDVFSTDATHERDVELLFRKPGPLGMKLKPDKVKNLHSVQSVHAVGQAMDWCSMVRAFYVRLLNPNPTQPRPNSSAHECRLRTEPEERACALFGKSDRRRQ